MTSLTKKERWVIVIGDPLLQGMETPICQPDLTSREVCCIWETHAGDVAKRLPSLVQPTDYPQLFFHVGNSDSVESSPRCIMKDYRALGAAVEALGAQVVVSSILLLRGKGFERSWCCRWGFGCLDHGTLWETWSGDHWGLMGPICQRKRKVSLVTGLSSWWRDL